MNGWINLTNYGIAVAGLMLVLMGLLMSVFSRHQEKWNRRFFIILFSLLIAYVGCDLLSQISPYTPEWRRRSITPCPPISAKRTRYCSACFP